MSLVICSNQESDSTVVSRDQSIFKPYSFRNALSSTLTLPKNCQVALESVKYNLDGTIAFSNRSYVMYFFYGETPPSRVGLTSDERMNFTTAVPIRIPLVDVPKGQVIELTFSDLVQKIQEQLNKFVFHPNLRDLVECSVLRDGTTDELEGIQIDFGQYDGSTSSVPTTTKEFGAIDFLADGANAGWSYENGSFTTNENSDDNNFPAVALLSDKPISLNDGELIVDFSDPNGSQLEWRVGLSRFVNRESDFGYIMVEGFWPRYMNDRGSIEGGEGPQPGTSKGAGLMFADYLVCRVGETLKVCHTSVSSSNYGNSPTWLDVVMGNASVPNDYNLSTNASSFTKVKFTCSGQRIKIEMLEADDTAHVLYDYDQTYADNAILKPINQSCWTMYPVLSIERDTVDYGNTLVVEDFIGCANISNHDILSDDNSWFQSVADDANDNGQALSLETRDWNDEEETKADFNVQAEVNGSGAIDLPLSLITRPTTNITPTNEANTLEILGFSVSRVQGKYITSPTNTLRIQSSKVPRMLSTKTMFVRLENFTQQCANARQGNRSKIIAHLPRFDGQVETGRIFHQPNERVYLDLNNSEPLKINSFDISFCYTNEQYATNLTGQSVVVLHFKSKGS